MSNKEFDPCRPFDADFDVRSANALALAYIGDTVHDLYVRNYLVRTTDHTVHNLHKMAVRLVCAHAQSEALMRIRPLFTEEEEAVFKRGRNARNVSVPKNADVREYHNATGLEAVWGYLFLTKQTERLNYLMEKSMEEQL